MAREVSTGSGQTANVNGNQISVYMDEDVTKVVAEALKRRGFNASTTAQHGNFELDDEEQLKFATSLGAVLLTHNVKDFPRIHYQFLEQGLSHKGIIVAKQVSVGEIVQRFLRLAAKLSAADMENRLEYLSNW